MYVATMAANSTSDLDHELSETPGEATILVSEFPPPPNYFRTAVDLEPPEIPQAALTRGTLRASAAAKRMRAEAEQLRLGKDATDAILGGVVKDDEDGGTPVVAVFGEIVEDPLHFEPLDTCENHSVIRNQVKSLNIQVIQGFIKLVQDLVHRPTENKHTRDELSHNIFLMLQECNKFREHQAREIIIELLEKQLTERRKLSTYLRADIAEADKLL
ncbi:hypothetical protein MPSEU_000894300 [Mayamaea pseudoterrestris]|nr:hypothetical protein MPSEU_000894300 [Mayamaea pseudoterrestris]